MPQLVRVEIFVEPCRGDTVGPNMRVRQLPCRVKPPPGAGNTSASASRLRGSWAATNGGSGTVRRFPPFGGPTWCLPSTTVTDRTCGHHFTDSKLAGRFATLFPQRHRRVPLVGYAVTQIAAHGQVYPGVCEIDPEGTWRAERLRGDGPMFVDLPHGTSTGLLRRLQERYPTAQRGWVGGRPLRSVPAFWDPTGDAPWDPRINRGHQRDSQFRLGMLKTLEVMFDPRNTGNRLPPDLEVFVPAAAVCFHASYAWSLEAADAAPAAPMSARAEAVPDVAAVETRSRHTSTRFGSQTSCTSPRPPTPSSASWYLDARSTPTGPFRFSTSLRIAPRDPKIGTSMPPHTRWCSGLAAPSPLTASW